MRNPFGSEAAAFRFALVAAAVAASLAVLGAFAGTGWIAAAAVLLLVAVVAFYALHDRRTRGLPSAPAHVGPPDERRLLVLAQEPVPDGLLQALRDAADRVLVVSAPVTRPIARLTSDSDDARERAHRRVEAIVGELRARGADASGVVGDPDPVQALEDALRTFGGDAIAVSAPPGRAGTRLMARVRERYALPVTRL